MTELDQLIQAAFVNEGKQDSVNRVYLALLRSMLFLPVKKEDPAIIKTEHDEPFMPLFTKMENHYFIVVFDTLERLQHWAGNEINHINYVEISGRDLIAGINENVFLGLNYGTEFYKEFTPDEMKHLKKIVMRIDQLKS